MALKDWTLLKKGDNQYTKGEVTFQHKETKNLIVVSKENYKEVAYYWQVWIAEKGWSYFKTKKEALAYAKVYMRKN